MKTLLRMAAFLSFGFCFAGGLWIFCLAAFGHDPTAALVAALGLFLMGAAFFAGAMLWLFAEKCCARRDEK
jgi:hypothetical protein